MLVFNSSLNATWKDFKIMSEERLGDSDIVTPEEVPNIELGEAISIKLDSMSPAEKDNQLTIMFMLLNIEKFSKYVDENFDIHQSVDHEAKKIHTAVVEKPTVELVEHKSNELIGLDTQKSLKAHMYLKSVGCPETSAVVKKLYEIFGGTEDNALVTSASDSDIAAELKNIKAAKKLV